MDLKNKALAQPLGQRLAFDGVIREAFRAVPLIFRPGLRFSDPDTGVPVFSISRPIPEMIAGRL